MKPMKLKNLVKKAKDELSWTVQEVEQDSGPLRIFSNPVERTHTIFQPSEIPADGQQQELLYLHELGHALLCERVHPFFSSGFPIAGLGKELFPAVSPVLNAASDWFVGHWMMEFCPDVALAELEKEFEATTVMMGKRETPNLDKFFSAVLITAQSKKYLNAPVQCSGILDAAVQAFLEVPPEQPSLDKILGLFNSLLALGAPLHCRHISCDTQDVLEFYRAESD